MDTKNDAEIWMSLVPEDQERLYKNPFVSFLFDLGHKYISRRSNSTEGTTLEIGCGVGYHIKFEDLRNTRKYIALDKNKGMLDRIHYKEVQKILGTAEKIPLPNKSVDCLIASHILEHINELDKALKEINRVLKDEGIALVVLPCDPGFLWDTATLFTPSRKRLAKLKLDYEKIMRIEHVNTFLDCVQKISEKFEISDITYFPFLIKNKNFNLIAGLTLKKKKRTVKNNRS